ncbi:MAG: hypothetical protein CM1200mP20_15790 [Pseudomonadota bacterium]|nr:MAG: hypothetical protein CM1200mP20_15790 [Pseudomonadota bacterium]
MDAAVTVEVRRMGGGFGGKETQAGQWAVLAALATATTGQPVKCRLDRDDDMIMTGKRHDFLSEWTVGFDDDGQILAADIHMASRCGCSRDLSDPVNDRALFPRRQCLLLSGGANPFGPVPNQHGLQHRLPGIRRTAGDNDCRADDPVDRSSARQRSTGRSETELLRQKPSEYHALSTCA